MSPKLLARLARRAWLSSFGRLTRKGREQHRLRVLSGTQPLRLVIGAAGICEPGWIGTDAHYLDLLREEDWATCFEDASVDAMLAEHVWEHLTPAQGLEAARRCFRYLRPGGYLRLAVPDGNHPSPHYISSVRPGGSGAGAAEHQVLYDHVTLTELLQCAGFRAELLEYFDSAGRFHESEWDAEQGKVRRSRKFDERNRGGVLNYTSLIVDAHKAP